MVLNNYYVRVSNLQISTVTFFEILLTDKCRQTDIETATSTSRVCITTFTSKSFYMLYIYYITFYPTIYHIIVYS